MHANIHTHIHRAPHLFFMKTPALSTPDVRVWFLHTIHHERDQGSLEKQSTVGLELQGDPETVLCLRAKNTF